MNAIWTIATKEVRDAASGKWLLLYGVVFSVLALALAYLGERNLGSLGFENFSRTTASLINLCLLLVPLMALSLGAGSIAGEHERGTLSYLLSQPINRWELVVGKFLGLVLSISIATIAGFGVAGLFIAFFASTMEASTYLWLLGLMLVLGAVMTGIGIMASAVCNSRVQALSAALFFWFAAVLFFDLVLIGMITNASLGGRSLLAGLLLNPVEIVRVLAIMHLEPDLEVLGPFGSYIMDDFGKGQATAVLLVALSLWVVVPISIAAWVFSDRSI